MVFKKMCVSLVLISSVFFWSLNVQAVNTKISTPKNLKVVSQKENGEYKGYSDAEGDFVYNLTSYKTKVTWSKVKGAKNYKYTLYNKTLKQNIKTATVSNNSLNLYLAEGNNYSLKIKAVKNKKNYSSYSKNLNINVQYDILNNLEIFADTEDYGSYVRNILIAYKNTGRRPLNIYTLTFYDKENNNEKLFSYPHVIRNSKLVEEPLITKIREKNFYVAIYPMKKRPLYYNFDTKIHFEIVDSDIRKRFIIEGINNKYRLVKVINDK